MASNLSKEKPGTPGRAELLAIYLNDHLAGATAGTRLAQRLAGAEAGSDSGTILAGLAAEIDEDRTELLAIMGELDVSVRRYKVYAGWVAELAGRLKLNGRLLSRSPLSTLLELEALRLGVEGKAAGWRTLLSVAPPGADLRTRLEGLIARAARQSTTLEDLRARAASESLDLTSV
jgi:hypothetical protein